MLVCSGSFDGRAGRARDEGRWNHNGARDLPDETRIQGLLLVPHDRRRDHRQRLRGVHPQRRHGNRLSGRRARIRTVRCQDQNWVAASGALRMDLLGQVHGNRWLAPSFAYVADSNDYDELRFRKIRWTCR